MSRRPSLLPLLVLLTFLLTASGCGTPSGEALRQIEATPPPIHPEVDDLPGATVGIRDPDGRLVGQIAVRIAHTALQRRRGLMGVETLPADTGMLFVYARDGRRSFWMKDTLVPLDIAWVASSGEIVATDTMQPCTARPCPSHAPGAVHRHVLEVPAGTFAALGLTPGWELELPPQLAPAR